MVPVLFSLVTVIGLLAVVFGFAGFVRAGRSAAFSGGLALSGAVLGLVAMGLATWGLVITLTAVERTAPQLNQAIAAPAASPSTSPETSPEATPETPPAAPRKAADATPTKNPPARGGRISLGAVADVPPFAVKIGSVGRRSTVSSSIETHKAQGSYVVVRMLVENTGNSPAEFTASDFRLIDADGKQYNWDSDATISQTRRQEGLYDEINPSQKITRTLVFDLPRKATPVMIRMPGTEGSAGTLMSLVRDDRSTNGRPKPVVLHRVRHAVGPLDLARLPR